MGVIDEFVVEYERQYDYWEASARTARGLLESELGSSGVRAIVTSRAKSVERLAEKLKQRNREKAYRSIAQITKDIVDLAGVRVALYFPGQMDEVEQVVRDLFEVSSDKNFPARAGMSSSSTTSSKRFSGYGARHFRVHISESSLSAEHARYSSAPIEVQVASVLMHAWSEVEHDLVYKPLEGELSTSEHALLDQLNGLVLAGEIALEQLQKAGDARVAAAATPFRDHYELAEFLRSRLSALSSELTDATLGRVDILYEYLSDQHAATAAAIEPYLDRLEQDFEQRPASAQLADLMLAGDSSRYGAYLRAISASRHPSRRAAQPPGDNAYSEALGAFVNAWVALEVLLNLALPDSSSRRSLPATFQGAREHDLITSEQLMELNQVRQLRNEVMHGRTAEPPQRLRDASVWLQSLTDQINRRWESGRAD